MRTLASLTGVAAATLSLSACAPYPDEPGDTPPVGGGVCPEGDTGPDMVNKSLPSIGGAC